MSTVKLGRYRHYKGKHYTVIGVARHSETEEELVVLFPCANEPPVTIDTPHYASNDQIAIPKPSNNRV